MNLIRLAKEEKRKKLLKDENSEVKFDLHKQITLLLQEQPQQLNPYIVGSDKNIDQVLYIPNFITKEDAITQETFLDHIPETKWIAGEKRKMCNFGGRPGEKVVVEKLPPFLQILIDRMVEWNIYSKEEAPNHVLINQYERGGGIDRHQDGDLYIPKVAVLTLVGSALLDFWDLNQNHIASIFLQPCSLHVVSNSMYSSHMHSIAHGLVDKIEDHCINTKLAGIEKGELIDRNQRRFSIVFVHKIQT
eukprot:c24558_g1_i1.p1 GENE.c24558_g1_i1~~c24558_g1_i1.p1  ORF type:complete len:247 (+),score=91.99 c24558_g1_i1:81-821(+)